MKKSITILGLIVLTSCTKNWNCQVTNSYNGQTSTAEVHFYGTTEEKTSTKNRTRSIRKLTTAEHYRLKRFVFQIRKIRVPECKR